METGKVDLIHGTAGSQGCRQTGEKEGLTAQCLVGMPRRPMTKLASSSNRGSDDYTACNRSKWSCTWGDCSTSILISGPTTPLA